jgi:hypothetical protein
VVSEQETTLGLLGLRKESNKFSWKTLLRGREPYPTLSIRAYKIFTTENKVETF